MFLLSDDDMVSHCYWKNDNEIITFENKHEGGIGYYIMKDRTKEFNHLWPKISNDGHPSYSPQDYTLVVFDSYLNSKKIHKIKVAKDTDNEGNDIKVIAKVFSPFKYHNNTHCDLHPR